MKERLHGNMLENKNFILSALKLTSLGLWHWTLSDNYLLVSDEVFSITGANPDEFDHSFQFVAERIIHPDNKQAFQNATAHDLEARHIETREYRIANPKKSECWVRISGQLVLDKNNIPIEMIGSILDITDEYLQRTKLESELDFIESLIEASPNPFFYKDKEGIYRFCNHAFLETLGLDRLQVIGKTVFEVSPPALASIYYKADKELFEKGGNQIYEAQIRYKDGSLHDVHFSKALHKSSSGEPLGLVGIMQDVTEQKASEHLLYKLHEVKDIFLETNHHIAIFQDEGALIDFLLPKLMALFNPCEQVCVLELSDNSTLHVVYSIGYDNHDAATFRLPLKESFLWSALNGNYQQSVIVNHIQQIMANKNLTKIVSAESQKAVESSLVLPMILKGQLRWIFSFDSSRDEVYNPVHVQIADFIREEIPILYRVFELYQQNLYLSRHDGQTGLMSRAYFDVVFDEQLRLAIRQNAPLSIAIFDLDGLKRINDTYGHIVGDQYILSFSKMLSTSFRESDIFARFGGDEFIGLFYDCSADDLIRKIGALQILFEGQRPPQIKSSAKYSFSFGISTVPLDGNDKELLLRIADQNMYRNKRERS